MTFVKKLFFIAFALGASILWVDTSHAINYGYIPSTAGASAGNVYTFNGTSAVWAAGGGGLVVIGTPQVDYEIVWNGSAAEWTAEGVSYSFAIASFADSQAATIEEGVGVWKSSGSLHFTASYSNGPPIGSTITFSGWSALPLSSPFTSTNSIANVNYPAVGGTVVFTLTAQKSGSTTATITHTFDNDRYWGVSIISSATYSSSDVRSFGNNELSNVIPKTFTVNPGAGQYIVYAYPSRLGTATFTVGGFAGGFNGPYTASVTNGSGFTENYSVYSSVNANLGSTTVTVTTP
jgi:hypothetical protein